MATKTGAKENQDFEMYQGETVDVRFAITDANGDPLDLTGFTSRILTLAFRRTDPISDAIGQHTMAIFNFNGTNDGLRVTLLPSATNNVKPGLWYHEVSAIDTAGRRTVLATGRFKLKGGLASA